MASSAPNTQSTPDRPTRRLQGSGAAAAGLLFAVLFVVGFWALDVNVRRAHVDLAAFYAGNGGTTVLLAGGYLVPFAGIAFLWFLSATRHRLGELARREDLLLGTMQLAAGVLFVALILVAGAASMTSAAAVRLARDSGPDVALMSATMAAFGEAVLLIFAIRVAAVFMIVTTTRAARAGLFPRWFTVVSYLGAALLLFALSYVRAVILVLPIWVGACSVVVLFRRVRHRQEGAAVIPSPAVTGPS